MERDGRNHILPGQLELWKISKNWLLPLGTLPALSPYERIKRESIRRRQIRKSLQINGGLTFRLVKHAQQYVAIFQMLNRWKDTFNLIRPHLESYSSKEGCTHI